MTEEQDKTRKISIEWKVPENIVSRYATNLVVQQVENEYILSFFEVHPPLIIGQLPDDIESFPAECVGRIIVPIGKMPAFIAVLQEHVNRVKQATEISEQ